MKNRLTVFKNAKRLAAVLGIAALAFAMIPFGLTGSDSYASDNTMQTVNYDVEVDVSEDNSYDFHEHLDIYYVTPHHGIYRYLPKQGQVISGIKVPGYNYDTYTESGYQVIKIGSGNYTLTGDNPYDIYYNIAMYDDENEEKDMLLLNLVPTDWETEIGSSTCVVHLPKKADLSKANVYSGSYGTASNEDNAVLTKGADGKTITITAQNIPEHHGVTLELELPQGYWEGAQVFGKISVMNMMLFLLGPFGAILLWYLYGRDKHVVKTLEFYPPDDLTPGEVGYLADGVVNKEDIISTIVYLADKGYMDIEEVKKKQYRFTATGKPVDGEPEYVTSIYKGIFHNNKKQRLSTDLGSYFGSKYQKAFQQLEEMFKGTEAIIDPNSKFARGVCTIAAIVPSAAFITWASANGED